MNRAQKIGIAGAVVGVVFVAGLRGGLAQQAVPIRRANRQQTRLRRQNSRSRVSALCSLCYSFRAWIDAHRVWITHVHVVAPLQKRRLFVL